MTGRPVILPGDVVPIINLSRYATVIIESTHATKRWLKAIEAMNNVVCDHHVVADPQYGMGGNPIQARYGRDESSFEWTSYFDIQGLLETLEPVAVEYSVLCHVDVRVAN